MFSYDPADATAIRKPQSSLASFKSRLVLPFWYWRTQVVLEKRPLNGCSGGGGGGGSGRGRGSSSRTGAGVTGEGAIR